MPLTEFRCLEGHSTDAFIHHADDKGCRTIVCEECGHTMGPVLSVGTARMLYFEEGRCRTIENLGDHGRNLSSYKQYREAMKKDKVELAGEKRGIKGWWV